MMKIGVQNGALFNDTNLEEGLKLVSESGFNYIDFNIDNYLSAANIRKGLLNSFFDKSIEELEEFFTPHKELAAKYGIKYSQMHGPFPVYVHEKDDINEYVLMATKKSMAVARFLECPYIVVHPVSMSHITSKEHEIEINLGIYRALMPYAKEYGVKICLENLFTGANGRIIEGCCSKTSEAIWYLETLNAEAGEELFTFCFDVGHCNLLAQNMYETIKALGKHIKILHIHDNDGVGDQHVMPYTSTRNNGAVLATDWEGFLRGLKEIGFDGVICFETFRVMDRFPKELHGDALKLIGSIGRYFHNRIYG